MSIRRFAVLLTVMCAGASACQFGERTIGPGQERPVVHGVLNPAEDDVVILVERTLTGRVDVSPPEVFDARDPIVTGNGVPISGARVEIAGPQGSAVAIEDVVATGRGRGVYRVHNGDPAVRCAANPTGCIAIVPGAHYALRVTTPDGQVVTGETTVPLAASPPAEALDFNRDRDSLALAWPRAQYAKRYSLRIDGPYGVFFLFSDSTHFTLGGGFRNLFAERLPLLFVPGFQQTVTAAAIDTNYFDYYRSGNDPFTGTGIINHLSGGSGVFGAYVPLVSRVLEVVADQNDPIEGLYVGDSPQHSDVLRLYVETAGHPTSAVSGNYHGEGIRHGVLGTLTGTRITFAALKAQSVVDTLFVFRGDVRGDSLVGALDYGAAGLTPIAFVKH